MRMVYSNPVKSAQKHQKPEMSQLGRARLQFEKKDYSWIVNAFFGPYW